MTSSGTQNQEDQQSKRTSDFSIDHILNKAGKSNECSEAVTNEGLINFDTLNLDKFAASSVPFTWLQCTRYCPPKVPRKREGPQKRQLGRHPRIPFTSHQLAVLEERFTKSPYLSSEEVTKLSRILQLADIRVKIWFQNRRARERRERQQPSELQKTRQLKPQDESKFDVWSSMTQNVQINQETLNRETISLWPSQTQNVIVAQNVTQHEGNSSNSSNRSVFNNTCLVFNCKIKTEKEEL